jgi:tRNA G18 (ribose-2'-O)-methylase SpoU
MSSSSEEWDESRLKEPTLLKYNVHTPLQQLPVDSIQSLSKGLALPVCLMLYNLHGDMNIAMSIRTAVILGCSDVWVVGRRRYDRRPEVGARNYIQVHRLKELPQNFFEENKLLPIFLEQGGTPIEDFSFKPYFPGRIQEGWKVVFLVGSESFGIPTELIKSLNAPCLTISQYGVLRSLNVAIASSIILYEYTRQWKKSIAV